MHTPTDPPRLNRRDLLARVGALTLLSAGLWPGRLSAGARTGLKPFEFLVVNDLHHASAECDPWFEALTRQMRGHANTAFVLVLGDLSDEATRSSLGSIRDHLRTLHCPFHVQVGNHDHTQDHRRKDYEDLFPGQVNYHFEHLGWQFVGIDSSEGTKYEQTRIQAHTLAYLDGVVRSIDPARPTVLFTHFPLAQAVKMAPLNSGECLDRFRQINLQAVFSGHYHAYTRNQDHGTTLITNRCCSRKRGNHDGGTIKGYWRVSTSDDGLQREFIEFKGPPGA